MWDEKNLTAYPVHLTSFPSTHFWGSVELAYVLILPWPLQLPVIISPRFQKVHFPSFISRWSAWEAFDIQKQAAPVDSPTVGQKSHWLNRGDSRAGFLLDTLGGHPFPCLVQLLEATCIIWLKTSFSIFQANCITSSNLLFPDSGPPELGSEVKRNPLGSTSGCALCLEWEMPGRMGVPWFMASG